MIRERALLVAVGVLAAAAVLFLMREKGPSAGGVLPKCMLHETTGLHCPGCGMSRAVNELVRGNWSGALAFNPAGVIALPLVLLWAVVMVPRWVLGKRGPRFLVPGARALWGIAGLVLAYWVLRNLPWWPFTLLAPA